MAPVANNTYLLTQTNQQQSTNRQRKQVLLVQLKISLHHEGVRAQWNGVSDSKLRNSPPTLLLRITSTRQRMKTWEIMMNFTNHSRSSRESRRRWLSRISVCKAIENQSTLILSLYIMYSRYSTSCWSSLAYPFYASSLDQISDNSRHKFWVVLFKSSKSDSAFFISDTFSFKSLVRNLFFSDFACSSFAREKSSSSLLKGIT